ncbi:MAG: xanthine dehydrogenase family protein subunit M [Nitrososphaerota archaeon]|jgi:carbon-monoxide dehydrogenase medium subunit|nr:xanthine dehydrogenase family protein subunit M [Nitrososphaerota archaeon]MDG6937029.1 xanthine dehydrogenase family protein subunit M [Nitrososphaerota archaeon]MDG6961168.1 xanthine dehydrogenase family protein subunit M [Nitrososphaerota archaeon]MDG6986653.1 xanthine dehydrogenase family protein subunit M [Nitrososphaerota archaeon]MDG7005300.1 xanthine dehydrogenase family protein subunit M [Nitrososphaerota archaeon]
MIPPRFEYAAPKSVREAVDLLKSRGGEAKVLAGGQSLIPLLKLRLAAPALLVDINRVTGLDYIRESGGFLRIGALTRVSTLNSSALLKKRYGALHDASLTIADPLVRNLGTVGGNLSHGDPSNDLPAVLLAAGGDLAATGPSGERSVRAEDFFVDTFTTALAHDEILTEALIPVPPPRSGGVYLKVEQKVADFATAGVAVQVSLGRESECTRVGIGLTSAGPTALKAAKAEEAMLGKKATDRRAAQEAGELAADASSPTSDIRGTEEYKRGLIRLLVARGLERASQRARRRT